MRETVQAAGAVASQVGAREMVTVWRLARGRCGYLGAGLKKTERRRSWLSGETSSRCRDRDCSTVAAVEKSLRQSRKRRGCWSQAASTHGGRWTEERKIPRLAVGILQTLKKKIYRCQKQSTIGRKGEGEGRSSRRRDHLI